MMIDLVQQEMEERGEEAREKAEAEHKVKACQYSVHSRHVAIFISGKI